MSYTYEWCLIDKGYKFLDYRDMTQEELKKSSYVELYLSPSIHYANCGWDHAVYHVVQNEYGTEEYVAIYPNKGNSDGRFINVSGNSLGAVAESVWNSVFR